MGKGEALPGRFAQRLAVVAGREVGEPTSGDATAADASGGTRGNRRGKRFAAITRPGRRFQQLSVRSNGE